MNNENIKINKHSSICIADTIFIDPFDIEENSKCAIVVFITHSHWDHLDIKSIKKIRNDQTLFVCPFDCENSLLGIGIKEEMIVKIRPGDCLNLLGINCEVIPSYNINKEFHPKSNNWVGYLLTINNVKYLICGDSDLTEELKNIDTDVLFVPIGGTYTMDAKDGARLANVIKPKLTIPVHYGSVVGDKNLENVFISNLDENLNYELKI